MQLEAGAAQPDVQRAGSGCCGERGVGGGQSRQGLEHTRLPCSAIEAEGIHTRHQLGQPGVDLAKCQQQLHLALFEMQAVQVWGERRPGGDQRCCSVGVGCAQVFGRGRVGFDADEHQPLATCGVVAPSLPGGQEVVAQAEAGFEDHKSLALLPAWWPFVASLRVHALAWVLSQLSSRSRASVRPR